MPGIEPDPNRHEAAEQTSTMRFSETAAGDRHGRHARPAEADTGSLLIRRGPYEGTRFQVHNHVTTIGRGRECDIVLDDVTVSRGHAEIRHENKQFTVADAGSLNGTYVNQATTDSAILSEGDEIWIGKFRLVFTTEAAGQ